jgi:hypothetical protein
MFVEMCGCTYTDYRCDTIYYTLIDTEFKEELSCRLHKGGGWDIITAIVQCYERRKLSVAKNMLLYLRTVMEINCVSYDLVMETHPALAKYRNEIDKLMLLL